MYQIRFDGRRKYRNQVWEVLIRDFFQQYVGPQDTVFDLGAGYGEFINHIKCKKKYAMDLNPDTIQFAARDVEVLSQDCSKSWPLSDDSLDVLFTSNFFEHLSDKQALAHTLDEARRCLKPKGRIIAMGPNIKHLPGAYWDFIDHHLPLTEMSLAEAFVQHGFEIQMCVGKFLPFTMASGPQYPVQFVAAYLRCPLIWRIFGKQFLVIGKRNL